MLRKKGILYLTFLHQLTQILVHKISRGYDPSWLHEALALHFSGEGPTLRRKYEGKLLEGKNTSGIIPLLFIGVLEEDLKNLWDQKSSELAYLQAYVLFRCLLKHKKEIKRLLDKLNEIDTKGTDSSPDGFLRGKAF
jgi:hypothetical protein